MILIGNKVFLFWRKYSSVMLSKALFISSLILLSLISGELNGQLLPKIRFKNLSKIHGLPNNDVNVITRDNLGYMWFGTTDGLCRYETPSRIQVLKVNENIKGGLKSANICDIHIDKKNSIWIGTRLGGLSIYNQEEDTWETFVNDPLDQTSISNDEVLAILEDKKGRIWIGTENGLNLFHPESKSFTRFKIDKNDPTAIRAKSILSIMEDDKGWIWVGTWEGSLHLMLPSSDGNIANSTFRNFTPPDKRQPLNVWKIFQDKQKRYWFGTHGDGLYLMQLPENASNEVENQNWKPKFHNYLFEGENTGSITSDLLRDIIQDSKDRIWVATVHGLSLINVEQLPDSKFLKITENKPEIKFDVYHYSKDDPISLAHDDISSVYEDEQGIIWLGTFSGISKYNWANNQFDNFELLSNKLHAPNTHNFYISPEKIGWFATGNNGILKYNFVSNEIKSITAKNSDILIDEYVHTIYSPDDENIYFGSPNGISCQNQQTQKVTQYLFPEDIKVQSPHLIINNLLEDKYGRIWIATGRGLFLLDKKTGKYRSILHDSSDKTTISDNSISDLYEDSNGFLWLATYNGLNRIKLTNSNDFQFTSFKHDSQNADISIPANRITSLTQSDDILYIGTTNGLCGYDYQSRIFINYTKTNNKFCVQSIERTSSGNLWASTTEGIFHFNTQSKTFNVFEKRDGLGDIAFRAGASQVDEEGYLYFGNRKGVTRLHPEKIITNTSPPPVYITTVKKISTEEKETLSIINKSEICLEHNNYYLSFDFSAVNYNSIEKNVYAYKLEGFEENWNYTTNNMSAVYTNLKHGNYTFVVRAANNDGVWNEKGARLEIIKMPAFWETIWFRLLMLAGLAGLIWFVMFIYTKNIRHRNEILNEYNTGLNKEIKERKRIERTLQEREQFLRLIMDNIPQHIYWIDKTHHFIGCNTAFLKRLGEKSENAVIGKQSHDLFEMKANRTIILDTEQSVLKTGEAILNQIIQMQCPNNNRLVWMSKNYIPLKNEEKEVFGVLVTGEDITSRVHAEEVLKMNSKHLEEQVLLRTQELDLKNKEIQSLLQAKEARNEELEEIVRQRTEKLKEYNLELQQSNNDLGQFAYIASHDMKEPLRIIGNFAGLLSRKYKGKLDKSADEYIHFIKDGTKRMSALMDSLLTYSQVGKKEIELSKVKLDNILFAKLHDLSEIIKERNVEMQIDDLPEIYCEKEQIGMVFFNLINNGIKFNQSEKPIIKVKFHEEDAPEGFWKFSVTDNGIGILPEFQSQIFEIFRRLHSKQEYKGTGIGLALTQKIVMRHGGTIKVMSIPAEGTTFIFTIAKAIIKETDGVQETVIRLNKSQDSSGQKYAFNKGN